MLEKIRSSIKRFLDYLERDKTDNIAFSYLFTGLTCDLALRLLAFKRDTIFFGIFYVLGNILTIAGLILILEILIRKKLNIKILTGRTELMTYILLIVKLFSQVNIPNYSSGTYVLSFIIIVYSLRNVLFSFYMFQSRNQSNISDENKKLSAIIYSFEITGFFLLTFSGSNIFFFKVFVLFSVYGIFYYVREKYLMQSIKSPYGENVTSKKNIFSHVWDINYLILYILLMMFLLFYYNVLTISILQPTLYYFYSTSAQVFAALLGVIVMFSILILQKEEKETDERNRFLKKGLIGFTILYIIILIVSFLGIALKDTINLNSIEKISEYNDINMFRDLLSVSIFEFVFLMIPAALLYLYAMISDFLKWDVTFVLEKEESLRVDRDTSKFVRGADTIKLVRK